MITTCAKIILILNTHLNTATLSMDHNDFTQATTSLTYFELVFDDYKTRCDITSEEIETVESDLFQLQSAVHYLQYKDLHAETP